jgi:hypothetical protein
MYISRLAIISETTALLLKRRKYESGEKARVELLHILIE